MMAPGRPSPLRRRANGSSSSNGQRQPQPPIGQGDDGGFHGLPEYLFNAYEQLRFSQDSSRPLLIDAETGHQITYPSFRSHAAALVTNMAARLHAEPNDTIAILATSSIHVPIVTAAVWLLGASVIALPSEAGLSELLAVLSQQHVPRIFFVSQVFVPIVEQIFTELRLQGRDRPHVVVLDTPQQQQQQQRLHQMWGLQSLYTETPNVPTFERPPMTRAEARDRTAVHYYSYQIVNDSQIEVAPSPTSYANLIDLFNHPASLRRSPSLPQTRSMASSSMSLLVPQQSRRVASREWQDDSIQLQQQWPRVSPGLAYCVLRMHRAYRLHHTMVNIFCCGGSYVVADAFDPREFVNLVAEHSIENAELTRSEIEALAEHIMAASASRDRVTEVLAPLKFIYTESGAAVAEFAPLLSRLLPEVEIVRTRFGSYVDPAVAQARRR
ncbi:hypothetical protein GQ54DRAFT_132795 [Martensiomyces pterosporus]|nr:hypothetical protein GQ54DRAFT_132795 [Martensiomyces pterosporus]